MVSLDSMSADGSPTMKRILKRQIRPDDNESPFSISAILSHNSGSRGLGTRLIGEKDIDQESRSSGH